MHTKRIIPCLDVKNGRVVKGVNFVNLKDAGDPVEIASYYNRSMADEIVFLDITASYDARDIILNVVKRTAEQIFIPLTVGGGIRTLDDFRRILSAGADKISVNSAALKRPQLIKEAAEKFGNQCVVVAIDAKARENGGFDVYLLDRKVINVMMQLDEKNSALTGQILWSGFRTEKIYYTRLQREIGESRWTLRKKIRLVTDTLFSFSTLPITIVSVIGTLSCFGATMWAVLVFVFKIMGLIDVSGWTTLFIFNLLSFGIIMLTLGILGGYLWRAFDASRNRPPYIIEEEHEQ